MEILNTSARAGTRILTDVVVPAGVLFGIIIFDHLFVPSATITPVANFLTMGVLALYLRPRLMIFWACCFSISSLFVLNHPSFTQHGPIDNITAETRSIGAVAGAVIATLLCANRWKASRSHTQLVSLVKRLPVPFVLSDKNGTLLYISEEAGRLMDIAPQEAAGQSYFALLFNLSEKGAAIQRYVNLLDSVENRESSIELKLLNCPDKSWNGTLMPVDLQTGKCLITVIEPLSRQQSASPLAV